LESEVKAALNLTPGPRFEEYGKLLLSEIEKRRTRSAVPAPSTKREAVTVRHLGKSAQGWSVAETENFRIYHMQSPDSGEQAAQVAEQTRTEMHRKWFGVTPPPWNPKCDLILYPTGQDYSRATGVAAQSPGHSSFNLDAGRVISRRIELHCDVSSLLGAVL